MLERYKVHLVILGIISTIFFWWYGYDTERKEITSCTAMYQRYVMADFSELVTTICYDNTNDSWSICTETDYWSESASDIWTIYTINGKVNTNYPYSITNGIGIPDYPPITTRYSGGNFDGYRNVEYYKYTVRFIDGDFIREPLRRHRRCMQYLGENIEIKTWYGIKYSIGL